MSLNQKSELWFELYEFNVELGKDRENLASLGVLKCSLVLHLSSPMVLYAQSCYFCVVNQSPPDLFSGASGWSSLANLKRWLLARTVKTHVP